MHLCPLCESTFSDAQTLTAHVIGEHAQPQTCGKPGELWLYLQPVSLSFRCVCGMAFRFQWIREGLTLHLQVPERLHQHIKLRGDWSKHILDCRLGARTKKRR